MMHYYYYFIKGVGLIMGQRQGVDWLLVFSVNSVEGWMMGVIAKNDLSFLIDHAEFDPRW